MPDHDWDRVERLFGRALSLPAGERDAFLAAQCAGDTALRRRLDALLAAHDTLAGRTGDPPRFLEALDPVRAGAILDAASEPPDGVPTAAEPERSNVGRYEVVRTLGRGGMGVVYLARDPALDRPVALKLLPHDLGTDARANRRLVEEARAASALDHPNIGTVYEVGDTDDGRYIAMAYYDGETLRERMTEGPLAVDDAIAIAAQIADGLAAAHANGIVHRDIKPENVIVTPRGLVKIVDFGIAKAPSHILTGPTGAVGTVAYMSPEQTRGDPVNGRTDLWALGVVLYEMLTGARPFRGGAVDTVIYAIRNDAPAPVRTLRAQVPRALSAVVERCLEKDPGRRFASADAVVDALRTAPTRRPVRRRVTAALALATIVIAAGAAVRIADRAPAAGSAAAGARSEDMAREPVVLADFTTRTADPRTGRVVTEALRIDLLQSPALRLAEAEEVAAGLRRMGRDPAAGVPEVAAREMAMRDGYKAVVAGEVGALGGGYVLTARVVDAVDGATLAAFRETAQDSTGLIAAVDRLSKRVRAQVGESVRALEAAAPLPRVATASLPALRRYAEAYELARSGEDGSRIAGLLEEAVALDSSFAAAHRALAISYWNMRADRSRVVAATRSAYELRHRLPERDRFLAEAAYHWQVLGDPGSTADAYRRVLAVDPRHAAARTNLGLALLFDGQPAEAERVLRAGRLAAPGDAEPAPLPLNLARALYFQGRTAAALAVIDSVAARPGGSPAATLLRARLLGGDGRWAEAEATSRSVLAEHGGSRQVRAEALRGLWHLALVQGRLREAESLYTELATLLRELGATDALVRARIQHADAQRTLLGDPEAARVGLHALLDRADTDVLTAGATLAPRAAAALAATGDTARATRLVGEWEALPQEARSDPDTYSPELTHARVEMAAGQPGRAIERLRHASSGTIQAIHYLPDLGHAYRLASEPDSAIAVLERYLEFRHTRRLHRVPGYLGPVLIQLGELHEEIGDTAGAIRAHGSLVELWSDADPELRPRVEHAQRRITALSNRDQ